MGTVLGLSARSSNGALATGGIILSAVMPADALFDAILAGADGYLTKDMPAGNIVKALQGFLRGELALTRHAATQFVHIIVLEVYCI